MECGWTDLVHELGPVLGARDGEVTGLRENFDELSARGLLSSGVPIELGGRGASYAALCGIVRELAHHSLPTALAVSLHFHPIALAVWKWRLGKLFEPFLRRIAAEGLVVSSTGTRDWLTPMGTAERVDGGYRIDARKSLPGGTTVAELFVTCAALDDSDEGQQVLQFSVPRAAEGVHVRPGTGAHELVLENVFIPEDLVELRRRRGWHFVWIPTLTLSTPIFLSCYLGAAERAASLARERALRLDLMELPQLLGEMENQLVLARLALKDMIAIAAEYEFDLRAETVSLILIRKTLTARALVLAVELAQEVLGGSSDPAFDGCAEFVRDVGLQPLSEIEQLAFAGRLALGLQPSSFRR